VIFSILLLIIIIFLSWRLSPREREEDAHVHGAGQIGFMAALALFGVDYFTSFYYATGELLGVLHPYNLQHWAYIAVGVIAFANAVFGLLYMYSLGIFREGGGSYTASMRYLTPGFSLVVAVVLIQDYIFTIVVSTLSGVDQLLSLRNAANIAWIWHFLIAAVLISINYYLTIRGRGESARVVFTLLGVFVSLTITMFIGLVVANRAGIQPFEVQVGQRPELGEALYHLLTASMKGLVALTGLEAMSDGLQFLKNEDPGIVAWGKRRLPRLRKVWDFYSGKPGIGRLVQTSFLFYGGLTTFLLTSFAIRFNAFDFVEGRTLIGNLAFIGFGQLPGGTVLFWVYQILAVGLLTAASMTAFQDLQATAWRDVADGKIPEVVVYRNLQGTFTRSVTAGYIIAVLIMFVLRARTSAAVPYYGIGVFLPITAMGLAIRQHILQTYTGRVRAWGSRLAAFSAFLSSFIFLGQIAGKWEEGGWVVLVSFGILVVAAHGLLISPGGRRVPQQIHRIVREKARVQGGMAAIVEWQSLKMQEYRYQLLVGLARFFSMFGIHSPLHLAQPVPAGDYDHAIHTDHPEAPSLLAQYLEPKPEPKIGGRPKETAGPDEEEL
jgi:hypothetical protein